MIIFRSINLSLYHWNPQFTRNSTRADCCYIMIRGVIALLRMHKSQGATRPPLDSSFSDWLPRRMNSDCLASSPLLWWWGIDKDAVGLRDKQATNLSTQTRVTSFIMYMSNRRLGVFILKLAPASFIHPECYDPKLFTVDIYFYLSYYHLIRILWGLIRNS